MNRKTALLNMGIAEDLIEAMEKGLEATRQRREEIRETAAVNQWKVLDALQGVGLTEAHFFPTTGYGFTDLGREALDEAVAKIFRTEKAALRLQIVSGTHALASCLYGNLKPGDEMLCITGEPYDTMQPVIGAKDSVKGSLTYWGVKYRQLDLLENGRINIAALAENINEKTALVYMQRSRGYSWHPSLGIDELKEAIAAVRKIKSEVIVMVDNCYGELVEYTEPTEVGADMVAGSLIKNLGGSIAPCGGYIAGKEQCVQGAMEWITAPGIGTEEGPTLGHNRYLAQGLFMAPQIVGEALEGSVLAAWVMEHLGLEVFPKWNDPRTDIIQAVRLGSVEGQKAFCLGIQKAGAVDHSAVPMPINQPGYEDEILMAGGTFIQGSSIELSADCPLRAPFGCYMQGGVSLAHVQIGVLKALQELRSKKLL